MPIDGSEDPGELSGIGEIVQVAPLSVEKTAACLPVQDSLGT